jgi:hypothetical protein
MAEASDPAAHRKIVTYMCAGAKKAKVDGDSGTVVDMDMEESALTLAMLVRARAAGQRSTAAIWWRRRRLSMRDCAQ